MYRRNTSAPPPGYGGTAFDTRPAWPPKEEPPRELKRSGDAPVLAPFAAGKRATLEPAPIAPSPPPVVENTPAPSHTEEQQSLSEDTILLFGILLLLMRGEDGGDLLPLLSMLLLL